MMKIKLRHSSWASLILHPHTWTLRIVAFIDGETNANNIRGRERIYTSTGLRATCLCRGRKKDMILSLRVAVDEN